MDFEEVIKKRQCVRVYQDKEVPDDQIQKILELANLSPSAGNLQARKVIIVKNQNLRQQIKDASRGFNRFPVLPPVILVICAVPEESAIRFEERGRKLYSLQDATIFASYLQLAAQFLGLASCWVGSFNEQEISKILDIPLDLVPVVMIPVGFADEQLTQRERKSLEEIILKKV